MKITISNYETCSDFQSYTAEVSDDIKLDGFIDVLEALVRIFYGSDIVLDARRIEK